MGAVLRGILILLVGLAVAVGALGVVAPADAVDTDIAFDPASLPDDLDRYLSDREAQVRNLRRPAAKRIVWADEPGRRTDIALVYVHGFSASAEEIRPVPDEVARALGANLFFTRLTGHGRDGPAMAEASAGDWLEDMAQAMAIGRRLGDRVVIVSTSTGGTLSALLAADPALADLRTTLAGIAFVSPNFHLANPAARMLSWPGARLWLPRVAGETRRFEPLNDRHARYWTTEYPTVAALPVQALIDRAAGLDWMAAETPALFYFSPDDAVVDATATEAVAGRWGGPTRVERVETVPGDDPMNHVIAGDILGPGGTQAAIATLTDWIRALP